MDLSNILTLINAVSDSSLSSFSLDDGSIKLNFETDKKNVQSMCVNEDAVQKSEVGLINNVKTKSIIMPDTNQTQLDNSSNVQNVIEDANKIISPLVGTFYSAQTPNDAPMVKVGDTVKKGQVIGIIEAMKLMNEIECEYDGVVKEILVNNEELVEYGQPLFVIA